MPWRGHASVKATETACGWLLLYFFLLDFFLVLFFFVAFLAVFFFGAAFFFLVTFFFLGATFFFGAFFFGAAFTGTTLNEWPSWVILPAATACQIPEQPETQQPVCQLDADQL